MSRPPVFLLLLPLLLFAACGPSEKDATWRGEAPKPAADAAADAGYLKPPALTESKAQPGGGVLLTGQAEPGSAVRLATATGEAFTATASPAGAWTITLAPSADVRFFGFSMSKAKRQVQSQGYLAILPDGRAALLRSGAAAFVYGAASEAPRLLSVDFGRDGAATLAGTARAGSLVSLRIDRNQRGRSNADSQGRFHIPTPIEHPLNAGSLAFELSGETGEQTTVIPISAAHDVNGPPRAVRISNAWRIDWMTPAGGMQSTILLDPAP